MRDGVGTDFSLGYSVDVSHSKTRLKAGKKHVLEVSLVRRSAREACHVYSCTDDRSDTMHMRRDPRAEFDLS